MAHRRRRRAQLRPTTAPLRVRARRARRCDAHGSPRTWAYWCERGGRADDRHNRQGPCETGRACRSAPGARGDGGDEDGACDRRSIRRRGGGGGGEARRAGGCRVRPGRDRGGARRLTALVSRGPVVPFLMFLAFSGGATGGILDSLA